MSKVSRWPMPIRPERGLVAALFLLLAGLMPAAADEVPERLVIGLLPGESAPEVIRLNEPLRAYLEAELGMEVELAVGTDYAATGEAIRFGRIDIAYLGPVTYVLLRRKVGLEPFARPEHANGPVFNALVIAPKGTGALADLAGKDVAFGDPASTSGHWVPRHELLAAGLIAGRDYQAHYLGAHDAVALAVQNGKAAAGGISEPVFDRLVAQGRIDGSAFTILNRSADIPEYAWTFRAGLDAGFRNKVKEVFLSIGDPAVLGTVKAVRFIAARDSDYDIVRGWIADIENMASQ